MTAPKTPITQTNREIAKILGLELRTSAGKPAWFSVRFVDVPDGWTGTIEDTENWQEKVEAISNLIDQARIEELEATLEHSKTYITDLGHAEYGHQQGIPARTIEHRIAHLKGEK